MVFHGFFFHAPLLSFLPLGYSYFVRVHCVPCSSLLYILLVTLSCSVFRGLSFFYTVSGYLPRPTFCLSLVSFLFFSYLVFLFCAVPSGPPGVSPVTTSFSAGHPTSLSSALAAPSSTSFGFSPLAYVFWGCSPLGGVSLGSDSADASRLLVILPV